VSAIIDQENSYKEGLLKAQELIEGSCSILILTSKGIYASRDKFGRTPLIVGRKTDAYCVSFESCTFANLGYIFEYELGPGEIVLITPDGVEKIAPPKDKLKICSFLWVYYGYPSSTYEGMSVELMRYRNGALMAKNDDVQVDMVAGVPDSGVGHAIGYSNESKIPFGRPFIKYTPTWSRSFMPQDQEIRNLVARMKLMPIPELVAGKRLLFCDDSIVRGTQLRETVELLYSSKAKEVHIRSACPPLVFGCKYLNFSTSRSEMDLIARQAIIELEGKEPESIQEYCDPDNEKYDRMLECIKKKLNFSTLKFQNINDMRDAIGIGNEKLCTYCWNGKE
jgi:amidophosphoribosyltransferase